MCSRENTNINMWSIWRCAIILSLKAPERGLHVHVGVTLSKDFDLPPNIWGSHCRLPGIKGDQIIPVFRGLSLFSIEHPMSSEYLSPGHARMAGHVSVSPSQKNFLIATYTIGQGPITQEGHGDSITAAEAGKYLHWQQGNACESRKNWVTSGETQKETTESRG